MSASALLAFLHSQGSSSSSDFHVEASLTPCPPSSATVQKIITEILATNDAEPSITFARDARDLLIDCCVEFITLISSEANEIAEREAKKTIATEHIDKALKELGFPEYVREVLASAGEMKESLKVRVEILLLRGSESLVGGVWTFAKDVVGQRLIILGNRLERRKQARWIRAV